MCFHLAFSGCWADSSDPMPSMVSFLWRWPYSKPSLWEDVMVWNWVKPLLGSFYFNLHIL